MQASTGRLGMQRDSEKQKRNSEKQKRNSGICLNIFRIMKPKENFCMTCRHRIIESGPEAGFAEMYCKKHYWISHIARDTFYKRCEEIRGRKKFCKEWEQGGIKGFFQRLFKKYSK